MEERTLNAPGMNQAKATSMHSELELTGEIKYAMPEKVPCVVIVGGGIAGARYVIAAVEQALTEHEAICPRIMGRKGSGKVRSTWAFKSQGGALQFGVIAIADEDGKAGLIGVDAVDAEAANEQIDQA